MTSKIVIAMLSLIVIVLLGGLLAVIVWIGPPPAVGAATAVPPLAGLLSVSFAANPGTVAPGQCSNLMWAIAGSTESIQLDQQAVGSTGQIQVCPPQSETHTLEARGQDGSVVSRQVSLMVQAVAPTSAPAATAANPATSVLPPLGAPTQPLPTAVPTAVPPTSLPPTQPPAAPTVPCAGPPAIASFNANPAAITAGGSSVLSWGQVNNATSAVIDQGIGGVATPGNATVKPGQTTTYTLTATGCGGTATKQVTITVNPMADITILPLHLLDLAVTKVGPVSLTRADKVYVDLKNTGNVDIDANVHVVCTAIGRQRGNPTQQVPTASDETLPITLSKGGTGFFWPSLVIDATAFSYDVVQCVVGLDGDPTPGDNQNGFNVP